MENFSEQSFDGYQHRCYQPAYESACEADEQIAQH